MFESIRLDRRALIERMLVLAGASAASGFSVPALAKAATAPVRGLPAPTFAMLTALSDTIIPRTDTPGAVDADVPKRFDALLVNWASPKRRTDLTNAILAIDGLAKTKQGKGFVQLTPAERTALLTPYDAEALKIDPNAPKLDGITAMMAGPTYMNPGYGKLKELIVILFYISEQALTTELSYVHAPGRWDPSVPVTPDTRPPAGGMF